MECIYTGNLGDLISICYEEFLAQFGDPELAAVATAAVVDDFITAQSTPPADPHA